MIVRTQPHVLPESFFRIPLSLSERNPFSETEIPEEEIALLNAPYRLIRNTENPNGENGLLASFRYNESYVLPFGTGAKLIHEQTITDTSEGIQQLAARKIAAIDRLAPWEISSSLKVSKDFQIGQYAHPTVHFLVPNRNKPLPASRTFRRALLYGLNREAILKELAPQHAGDVQLLSGAMPRGVAGTAPIGYGYDLSVSPRIYDAKLAVALALMSITNARDKGLLKEEERPKVPRKAQIASDMPELVLAYPENTASELAARLIWRYWEMIGIPVRIIPYSQAEPIGRGTKVDFWYVPCQVTEPMFDAHAILSKDGLAGASSVYMELALEKLRQAQTWPEISTALQEIHRLTHEETSVLPLWQWRDCFIVHRELTGVLQRDALPSRDDSIARNELIHFYQNVEHWNVPFHWNELEK